MERPVKHELKEVENKKPQFFPPKELIKAMNAQKKLNKAQEEFGNYGTGAFYDFINTFKPLNIEDELQCYTFFDYVEALKDVIKQRKNSSHNSIDDCIHELVRLQMVGSNPKKNYEEVIVFYKTWQNLKGQLFDAYDGIWEGGGDDAFSDFIDALPFAGGNIIGRILEGGIYEDHRLTINAIGKHFDNTESIECAKIFHDLIVSENYIESTIEEKLKYFFNSYMRSIEDSYDLIYS